MERVIAYATPVFFALIALEYLWGRHRGRDAYRLNDAINSISLGVLSQLSGLFTRLLRVGLYTVVFSHVALFELPGDAAWVWLLALVFYDFCYYWNHRLGHESAVFWAAHVVHHQSQEFNLSTALRQTSTGVLLGWVFYLPMAVVGIPPGVFAAVALIDLLYQYWIHTEHVRSLGWIDRVFATPSNHRVHHAINPQYLDRNYGGILILWDRCFGSFAEEREACVYGTRAPLNSWDPIWANLEQYAALARKSAAATGWRDRLLVWLMPPGWLPAGATTQPWAHTSPPATPRTTTPTVPRYDPPMSRATRVLAVLGLALAIVASVSLLWRADNLSPLALAGGCVFVAGVLWLVGALMQGRLPRPATPTV